MYYIEKKDFEKSKVWLFPFLSIIFFNTSYFFFIMKTLKFAPPLPEMILSWQKNTTWRISDDKNISIWDMIECFDIQKKNFATIQVTKVKNTTFWNLDEEDKNWHETFETDEIMYATYEKYYNKKITPKTEVKVVKFEVI